MLLFDIDGTLVDTEGAGLESLRDGFYEAFPAFVELPFPALDLGGATDGGVAMFLFEHFGLADSVEVRGHFFRSYSGHLKRRLQEFRIAGKGRVLPGVPALLNALREEGVHEIAVLTGNTEQGAWTKLRHFGLDGHFRFGAFGDDHHDRDELGPLAVKRAADLTGITFAPHEVVVIGDTPKDVACARALGARSVAVATGTVPRSELEAAKPDLVLDDLADSAFAMEALGKVFLAREGC